MDNPIVKLENVHRYFHEAHNNNNKLIIAQDLNMEVQAGELISILGASGSGKSTLLQAIGLLDNIQTGKIFIKQKRVDNLSLNQKSSIRLKQIGFVYQHHHLLADFSTLENITIPMTLAGTPQSKANQQALELLDNFGIADKRSDMPSTLSGGEKQRVAIARALANRPDILLADEPTGNLDPLNSDNVYEQFRKYVEQYKQTTIIVTHEISLAKKTDKIFELKNGILNKIDKSTI